MSLSKISFVTNLRESKELLKTLISWVTRFSAKAKKGKINSQRPHFGVYEGLNTSGVYEGFNTSGVYEGLNAFGGLLYIQA